MANGSPMEHARLWLPSPAHGAGVQLGRQVAEDPVAAGEETPPGFRQVLPRDRIEPIYHPVNVPADEVDWDDHTLVLGVAIDGEARAYPIRPLNRREIAGEEVLFGNHGALFGNALTMVDHATGSVRSQISDEVLLGPWRGNVWS